MKVLLVSEYLIFDSIGGTEVYISALANFLLQENNEVYYLKSSYNNSFSEINNVYTLSQKDSEKIRLNNFKNILNELKPDVVHFHTISKSINFEFLRLSKSIGIKTYLTSHTPDLTCMRGDLLQLGHNYAHNLHLNF